MVDDKKTKDKMRGCVDRRSQKTFVADLRYNQIDDEQEAPTHMPTHPSPPTQRLFKIAAY